MPDAGHYRFVIVGFTTREPSTYDFSTWLVTDATPDDPSGGPGIAVTGDPFSVGIGQTVDATLAYSGVDRKGLYLGLATFHDSSSPTAENTRAASVVELNKTADTTSAPAAGPAPAATPARPSGAHSSSRRLALARLRARLRRGILSLRVDLSRKATVAVRIRRGKRTVYRATRRGVPAGPRTLRLRVGKRLRHGRAYRITVTASIRHSSVRRNLTLKVPR
jgi:hypothetical protein